MRRLHYISPSLLPSRSANAVHVVLQCDALAAVGTEVVLYAKRTLADAHALPAALRSAYGVDVSRWRLITFHSQRNRGDTLRIAAMALRRMASLADDEAVLSRNLYAAFFMALRYRRPLLYETHQLEYGLRGRLQRWLMTRRWVTTIAISQRLVECLREHHAVAPLRPLVLHDAARTGIQPLDADVRRPTLSRILQTDVSNWRAVGGYFGHLYPGRGIEIIETMAAQRRDSLFVVFGGTESDVAARRAANQLDNLRYMGHVPHPAAQAAMLAVDVLLMPYQREVSIGVVGHDTARWMSPMKMFEYLASGVPLISSDLPVLREVLHDEANCLLVAPDDARAWVAAFDRLVDAPQLAAAIGRRAHADYVATHSWTQRAQALLRAAAQR